MCPQKIHDDLDVPHGKEFVEALTDQKYKSLILDYICAGFISLASSMPRGKSMILDSPTFGCQPVCVKDGVLVDSLVQRQNNKGEADFAVWWHAQESDAKQIIVHAGDTDIYMYGMSICDRNMIPGKNIVVERIVDTEYVHVSEIR